MTLILYLEFHGHILFPMVEYLSAYVKTDTGMF